MKTQANETIPSVILNEDEMINLLGGESTTSEDPENEGKEKQDKCNKCDKCDKCFICF